MAFARTVQRGLQGSTQLMPHADSLSEARLPSASYHLCRVANIGPFRQHMDCSDPPMG